MCVCPAHLCVVGLSSRAGAVPALCSVSGAARTRGVAKAVPCAAQGNTGRGFFPKQKSIDSGTVNNSSNESTEDKVVRTDRQQNRRERKKEKQKPEEEEEEDDEDTAAKKWRKNEVKR